MPACGICSIPASHLTPGISDSDFHLYVDRDTSADNGYKFDVTVCQRGTLDVPKAGCFVFRANPAAFWVTSPSNYLFT